MVAKWEGPILKQTGLRNGSVHPFNNITGKSTFTITGLKIKAVETFQKNNYAAHKILGR